MLIIVLGSLAPFAVVLGVVLVLRFLRGRGGS